MNQNHLLTLSFTREELLILTAALSCTQHLRSSTFEENLIIQNDLANRVFQLLKSDDACRRPAQSSDALEQGGTKYPFLSGE